MLSQPLTPALYPRLGEGNSKWTAVARSYFNAQKMKNKILWIDGVGGYAVWEGSRFEFGRSPDAEEGVPILGDLPSRHSTIRRSAEDWILEGEKPVLLNGHEVSRPTLVKNGDKIGLSNRVEISFEQPNPCSSTALLKIISRHRWSESLDGVLLMGQTCLLGRSSKSHIRVRQSDSDLLLYRSDDQWLARLNETTQYSTKNELADTVRSSSVTLTPGRRVQAGEYAITLL
jgi:hypothetical protein